MATIVEWEDKYADAFRDLNLEWLKQFNLLESHDVMVLDNPVDTIINRGGAIFLAKEGDIIVGTAALMKEHDDCYELAKMTVAAGYRGKGISKLLMEACIGEANKRGVKRLLLFSNHQLKTALQLYERFGFQHIAVEDSPFETADVKMELLLTPLART
jgi:GNAT superfamily N-acetyltransferase